MTAWTKRSGVANGTQAGETLTAASSTILANHAQKAAWSLLLRHAQIHPRDLEGSKRLRSCRFTKCLPNLGVQYRNVTSTVDTGCTWVLCSYPLNTYGRIKEKRPVELGVLGTNSLTMSYFHTGTRTIIGAEAFHCPVRDGKEWDRLAMVIRHNLLSGCILGQPRPIHRVSNQIFDCIKIMA